MSLVPMLFSDWWEDLERPHHVHEQHFGLSYNPDDIVHRGGIARHAEQLGYPFFRRMRRRHHPFHHALAKRTSGKGSSFGQMERDKDMFFVTVDVQQFTPDEITVKVVDRSVVVEAKHEEREDEHGWIARQFTRKYAIPPHFDIEQIESKLSSDGILTINAPRKKPMNAANNERTIKIQYTGEPAIFHYRDTQTKSSDVHEGDSTSDYSQQRPQMSQRGKKTNVKGA